MKRENFFKFAVFATIILFSLVACEKENTNSPSPIGKATISGKAWATFDFTATNPVQIVPAGTKIYASFSSKDLITYSGKGTYGNIIDSARVDANGNYSFTIDANQNDVNVSFYSNDFTKIQHTSAGDTLKIYTLDAAIYSKAVTVRKDVVRYEDLQFTVKSIKE